MKVDLLEFASLLVRKQGIQMIFLMPPYENLSDFDYDFRGQLFEDFDYMIVLNSLKEMLRPGCLVHIQDFNCLHYSAFAFPEHLKKDYPYEYCILGPVTFQTPTAADFYSLIETYQIPPEFYRNIQEFYNQIPVISTVDTWFCLILQFCNTLLGVPVKEYYASLPQSSVMFSDYSNYRISSNPMYAPEIVEARYLAEEEFLKAVMAGDAETAVQRYHQYRNYKLMPRSEDSLINGKIMVRSINTLIRKNIQEACIHPFHIDNLSTQIASQIGKAVNLHQLKLTEISMVRKYCMLVNNYSRKNHSALIQFCMDYIDFHYKENLSLGLIAHKCSVTTNYLSSLFKKETGQTLTSYIHQTRIHQSLILLNTTNLPLQAIAAECGYQDTNYFTRMFKRILKLTPSAYRKQIFRNSGHPSSSTS